MKSKLICLLLVLGVVPVFFFIYQPSLQLGGLGLMIGYVGVTATPIIILYLLCYFIRREWR